MKEHKSLNNIKETEKPILKFKNSYCSRILLSVIVYTF